jgi:predicted Zn-dependent protease
MHMSDERMLRARELLEKFPDNDLARFNLAQALFDAGQHGPAAEQLGLLCGKRPDWMVAHILLGKCRLVLGEATEARRLLEHAHRLAVQQHHDGPREELEQLLKTL